MRDTPETKLAAIIALLDGRFDDPALVFYGPLHTSLDINIRWIITGQ